jgi:hypothetical protein
VNVNDVIVSSPQDLTKLFPQRKADGYSPLRAVGPDGLTVSNSNHVRLGAGTGHVGGDDVHVMTKPTGFASEEVHMFANAAEVRVVVLGYERNS